MRRLRLPALLVPLALVGPLPAVAQESPSPSASPTPEPLLTGTIDGTDGRAVNALLGFDWRDGQGRRLRRDGCVASPECPVVGHGSVVRTNPTLTAVGTSDTATASTTWSVQPPPGARRLFLEVYPQNERLRTDEARYGHAVRHGVTLPHDGPAAGPPAAGAVRGGRRRRHDPGDGHPRRAAAAAEARRRVVARGLRRRRPGARAGRRAPPAGPRGPAAARHRAHRRRRPLRLLPPRRGARHLPAVRRRPPGRAQRGGPDHDRPGDRLLERAS